MGVLTRVFPPELVDEVIAGAGRTELRRRALPARVMAYFAMGMALYSEGSYADVLSQLTDGLSWASGWSEAYVPPSKSAIFQARARLGCGAGGGVVRVESPAPLAAAETPGAWLAGRRLVAIDGTTSRCGGHGRERRVLRPAGREQGRTGRVPAGPAGRLRGVRHPRHLRRRSRAPTRTLRGRRCPVRWSTASSPGMVLLADRGFYGFALLLTGRSAPGRTCCGGSNDQPDSPEHFETLPDGSWLA